MRTRMIEGWRPQGRVRTPAQYHTLYPDIGDPITVMREFINHHLSTGKQSNDWDAEFHNFCQNRQRQGLERRRESGDTDSMGLPLDGRKRATMQSSGEGDYGIRFLAAIHKHQDLGLSFTEAHQAAVQELDHNKGQ